jgi:type II secretory pathway pseudopilin PulG
VETLKNWQEGFARDDIKKERHHQKETFTMSDMNQPPPQRPVSPSEETVPDVPRPVSPTEPTIPNPQGAAWPPTQPAFQRQEVSLFPRGITILIIILALALVGSGLAFILYSATVQYSTTLDHEATSVALSTVRARATTQGRLQATAQAFATANSNIYATATAQTAITATATTGIGKAIATATAYDSTLQQATRGTAVLNDQLNDNFGNNKWDEITGTTKGACAFISRVYHAIEPQLGYYQPCVARAADFSNFAYQIHMVIDRGEQAGIIFRFNSANSSFYVFRVGINGSYALDLYKNRVLAATLTSGLSGVINTGIKNGNDLAVLAKGDVLYLYINRQFVASVTNSYLSSGAIGVIAIDYRNASDAEFSSAQVWNV